MENRLSLSVMVPVYNEQYLVETSLARLGVLAESPWLERVRVIVVDDASSEGTARALERFRENLPNSVLGRFEWIFLRHEKNQGKTAAIRTAIEQVDTDSAGPTWPTALPSW